MTAQGKGKQLKKTDYSQAFRYCELGTISLQKGEYQEALRLFKKALEIKPDYRLAMLKLATTYYGIGEDERATKLSNAIIELPPQDAEDYVVLGYACHFCRRLKEAIKAFTMALELKPQDPEALFPLAAIHGELLEFDEAIENFRKALRLKPQDGPAYYALGTVCLIGKRYSEAADAFNKAIALNASLPKAYYGLGESYRALGRLKEAADAYAKGVEIDPLNADILLKLAVIYFEQKENEKAIDISTRITKIGPKDEKTYLLLVMCYLELKQYEEAIKVGEQAFEIAPDSKYSHICLAIAYMRTPAIDKAIIHLERAIKLAPQDLCAHLFLAYAYPMLGRYEEALSCIESVIALDPEDSYAYLFRAICLFKIAQYDRAASAFDAAKDKYRAELDKNLATLSETFYLITRGITNWNEGKYDQAQADFLMGSEVAIRSELDDLGNLARVLRELIPIDIEFEKVLLSSESLGDLSAGINKLFQSVSDVCRRWLESNPSEYVPLIGAKALCIWALAVTLGEKKESSEFLVEARRRFSRGKFIRWKTSVEAIEEFAEDYIKLHELHKGQLTERQEAMLLRKLRPAADLSGAFSRSVLVERIQEAQEELFSLDRILAQAKMKMQKVWDKTGSMLEGAEQERQALMLLLLRENIYEVYLEGKKPVMMRLSEVETLRKNKTKYELWIEEGDPKVRINKEEIVPGMNVYKLLIHIGEHVGKCCSRAELFKAIWGCDLDNDDHDSKLSLQQMFSRYVYKYGGKILKRRITPIKGGYDIKDNLKACVIVPSTSKQTN